MKLTIGNQMIALPMDAKISLEKTSPIMNEDTGSFSYPFPVPTIPNQKNLGWPGKLERVGDIPDKSFILEEQGIQVLRGEVAYDNITKAETGIILKSGYTEFFTKYSKLKLEDLDYGWEWWPAGYADAQAVPSFGDKLTEWDQANTTNNGKYVVTPFKTSDDFVNTQWWTGPSATHLPNPQDARFCLQFYVSFILKKIFEVTGYEIIQNDFENSDFNKAIVFGNIINFHLWDTSNVVLPDSGGVIITSPGGSLITPRFLSPLGPSYAPQLYYSYLMPDLIITDFLNAIKTLFGLFYEINESNKQVSIRFIKSIFQPENLSNLSLKELDGWEHEELNEYKGFALRYTSQDDTLDTKWDYKPDLEVVNTLPDASKYTVDQICHVSAYNRDYQVVSVNGTTNGWKEVGRLKEYRTGEGENALEISVNIPGQYLYLYQSIWLECPYLQNVIRLQQTVNQNGNGYVATGDNGLTKIPLSISLYHGRKTFAGLIQYPYCTFDHYSIPGLATVINTGMSLKPDYLFAQVYQDKLNWQTYNARFFTKIFLLSLPQVVALQWGNRYVVNGVEFILNKINYELPHRGVVKVEGWTV
jgi:hypothetical protein